MAEQKENSKQERDVQVKNTETVTDRNKKQDENRNANNSGFGQWGDRHRTLGSGRENLGTSSNP